MRTHPQRDIDGGPTTTCSWCKAWIPESGHFCPRCGMPNIPPDYRATDPFDPEPRRFRIGIRVWLALAALVVLAAVSAVLVVSGHARPSVESTATAGIG